ncbi:hypothetical protein OS493_038398 [Desmophyllum pertusum]|uniref:Uncharacterized protein n=1 Tax=Desmophyllum pertusum TaxID=174260 RepID=A0A9W9YIY4_9CNID|nr:hypothetical protein OS493_038398 [Desmophyllum pertusum]
MYRVLRQVTCNSADDTARNDCPSGWTEEYHGYLMSEHHGHKKISQFHCIDKDARVCSRQPRDKNGPFCTSWKDSVARYHDSRDAGKPGTNKAAPGPRGLKGERGSAGRPGLKGPQGLKGIVGSSYYWHTGGGGEYICLPNNPKYDKYKDGYQSGSYIYGTEYEIGFNPFKHNLHNHDAPCAVCLRQVTCNSADRYPPGMTVPHTGSDRVSTTLGTLMSDELFPQEISQNFICIDRDAEFVRGSRRRTRMVALPVTSWKDRCGSLPWASRYVAEPRADLRCV